MNLVPTLYPSFLELELDLKHHKHLAMHALTSILAALALLATSAEAKAKAKPRDAILLSQVSPPSPAGDQQPLPHQPYSPTRAWLTGHRP